MVTDVMKVQYNTDNIRAYIYLVCKYAMAITYHIIAFSSITDPKLGGVGDYNVSVNTEAIPVYWYINYVVYTGSLVPPSSRLIIPLYLPLAEIVIVGVLTGLALTMAVALIAFNILWRTNK